ncbi:MAG: energy transducer TonB [Candidatus Zixiibacteriota bacterium]|nr:MAG: energy transducer TonB [candidate division Zixibacteria bacterium]
MQLPNALYSPYGAYELKARYQRNFGLGTIITLAFVLLILLVVWVITALGEEDLEAIDLSSRVIKTVADLGPPPSVQKRPPQVNVNQPQVAAPKVGIPKPVADDEVIDEDVVLATRDELAEIVAPDITAASDGEGDIVVDIADDDYLPAPDEFYPVEIYPEMIHQTTPEYPRLARQAGITGIVWVRALVDKEGNVRKAMVHKTSGTKSLDEAAVAAAYDNKFKPGIQNGRPVNCWVSYKVTFELDN